MNRRSLKSNNFKKTKMIQLSEITSEFNPKLLKIHQSDSQPEKKLKEPKIENLTQYSELASISMDLEEINDYYEVCLIEETLPENSFILSDCFNVHTSSSSLESSTCSETLDTEINLTLSCSSKRFECK